MPLEDTIVQLTAAVNNLAAVMSKVPAAIPTPEPVATPAPAPKAKKEAAPTPAEEPGPTEEQLATVAQKILDKGGKPKIVELNAKFGVARGRELLKDPAKKADAIRYYKELTAIAEAS